MTSHGSHSWAVQELAASQGRAFVAPYDDPYTIAGQGTVGTEILRQLTTAQLENLHAIFCPVGGGGLIAGIAAYVKALRPDVKVIGVECTGAIMFDVGHDRGLCDCIWLLDMGLWHEGPLL